MVLGYARRWSTSSNDTISSKGRVTASLATKMIHSIGSIGKALENVWEFKREDRRGLMRILYCLIKN